MYNQINLAFKLQQIIFINKGLHSNAAAIFNINQDNDQQVSGIFVYLELSNWILENQSRYITSPNLTLNHKLQLYIHTHNICFPFH